MNQKQWNDENLKYETWYKNNYPFLEDFTFPIPIKNLLDFYNSDRDNLNLARNTEVYNKDNYEIVFSYFLYNYPKINDETRPHGRSWLELTIENFPKAVSKTFSDIGQGITNVTSFIFNPLVIAGFIALFIFLKTKG